MKEFFKNLPDETTPYEAEKFNDLLNGQESMGSIVVEDIKCKNLYNPALVTMNNNNYYYEFEIDNTKPYVFQSPYDWTLVYGIDASGNETRTVYETGKSQNSRVVTFVPNSNEVKIKCAFYTDNFQGYNGVQLEQNDVVTNYNKYINFDILKGEEWKELSLSNEFENYGENYAPLRLKKIDNIVYVQGMIKSKTTGYVTITTLPETYRPKYTVYSICISGDNAKGLIFQPNGELKIGDAVNNSWIGIDTYFPID